MTRVHIINAIQEELERNSYALGLVDTYVHQKWEHITAVYQEDNVTSRFHIINKAWSVERIRSTIQDNTSKNISTCFLVDKRIMPIKNAGDVTRLAIEPWIATLQVFTDGNIYVYDPDESWSIRPVHFHKNYNGVHGLTYSLTLRVGDVVDFSALQPGMLTTRNDLLTEMDENGVWRTRSYLFVHFGQLKFWERQDEARKQREEYERIKRESHAHEQEQRWQRNQQSANYGAGGFWSNTQDWEDRYKNESDSYWNRKAGKAENPFGDFDNFGDFYDWYTRQQGFNTERQSERSQSRTNTSDYDILGVSASASDHEVKSAYRALARQYHPDVSNAPDATEKMQRLNAIYELIKRERNLP